MKSSSTSRTSSGKICKICSKKGSPCHLHTSKASGVGSGGTKSKKSSSPKKITPELFDLEHLPLPALQQVLLNISDKAQLNHICRNSRQAAKVCRTPEFKKLYSAKYMGLFVGQIKHILEKKPNRTVHTFHDEVGNNLEYIEKGIGRGQIQYRSNKTWLKSQANTYVKTHKGFQIYDGRLLYIDFQDTGRYWAYSTDANDWWQNKNLFPLFHSIDPVIWPTKASVTLESVLGEIKRRLSSFKPGGLESL